MSLTYRDAVAALFRANPGVWIDGLEIARYGGAYAHRTRVSDCRTQLGMTIENRVRRLPNSQRKVSEYRYRPASLLELVSVEDVKARGERVMCWYELRKA